MTHYQFIDLDLENGMLEIKTNSAPGSGDLLNVVFYKSSATSPQPVPGFLRIYFTNPIKYHLLPTNKCMPQKLQFLSLPSENEKIWGIKIGFTEFEILCNGEQVASFVYQDSCLQLFGEPLKKIIFWRHVPWTKAYDTASLEFRSVKKNALHLGDKGESNTRTYSSQAE